MSEIADLESRISAAMARIGRVVDGLGDREATTAPEDLDHARQAAETAEADARQAIARAEAAEAEVARLLQALEAETTASGQLRERVGVLKSMKESQGERIAELEAELNTLSGQRASDRDELDGLIRALEPLVQEHGHG